MTRTRRRSCPTATETSDENVGRAACLAPGRGGSSDAWAAGTGGGGAATHKLAVGAELAVLLQRVHGNAHHLGAAPGAGSDPGCGAALAGAQRASRRAACALACALAASKAGRACWKRVASREQPDVKSALQRDG